MTTLEDALRIIVREEVRSAMADLMPPVAQTPLAYTLSQAAEMTGLSEKSLSRAIAGGRLAAMRSGRSVRIPAQGLADFVNGAAEIPQVAG